MFIKFVVIGVRRWLRTNGLSGMKLTIVDALKPTIIQQKPTYISSVGKEVHSKVYGEVRKVYRSIPVSKIAKKKVRFC